MSKRLGYMYVILGAACWGLIGLFARTLGELGVSVFQRVTIRNFGALVVMTLVFALTKREVFHIKGRHLLLFAGSGLLSVQGMTLTSFVCQQECSLAVSGILLYLAPSFVVLMSALFWKAPITKRKVMALVVSFLGCVLVSGIMSGALTVSVTGLLLGIGAGFCYATYTIFAHYGLEHYDSLTMIYWTFFFAGLGSLAFLNWGELAPALPLGTTWIGMAGLVVIATVLPYLFYTKGLEVVESGKASIIANVEPVVAALTGVVFFHEVLNVWTVLGIVCVLGGVVLLAKE